MLATSCKWAKPYASTSTNVTLSVFYLPRLKKAKGLKKDF
jgi:hypothetical protein